MDVNHDFLGKVVSYDPNDQCLLMYSRNYFEQGEDLEVLSSTLGIQKFHCEWIKNDKDEYIEKSNHPMNLVKVSVPFEVHVDDMIRRAR